MVGRIAYAISEKREFLAAWENMEYHTKSHLFIDSDSDIDNRMSTMDTHEAIPGLFKYL